MARVLVGVTGGIAAYKACELVRLFVQAGHEVFPLVTPDADRFVRAETFFALARRPRTEDEMYAEARLKSGTGSPYEHLTRADLFVIAPATANTIAKLAQGLADNLVTEAALAHRGPLLIAPAMNPRMWSHPATRANVDTLRARQVHFVGPDEGETAEGELGVGRMAEPEEIYARARMLLGESDTLRGKHVLVTAGGTREPLDAVRFLGNRSSGRMGVALAAEARKRGAEVTLLAANLAVPPPPGVHVIETPTAEEMLAAARAHADADVVLMAAAVADYRPASTTAAKRPKSDDSWQVELEPTTDILRTLAAERTDGQILVGFAADHGERGLARAREKLAAKGVDLVVYNDVSRSDIGFDTAENEVTLIGAAGERRLEKAPKDRIAVTIVEAAEELLRERT
jgi:phosphopantothenoylcysteine decarboxylase/phosphopantothenate--cysteine ligase